MPRGVPARRAARSTAEVPQLPPPRKRVRTRSETAAEAPSPPLETPLPRRAAAMSAEQSIRRRAMSGRRGKAAAGPAATGTRAQPPPPPKKGRGTRKDGGTEKEGGDAQPPRRGGRVVLEAPADGMVLGRACAEALVGACRDSVGEGRVGVAFDVETTAGHVAVKLWRVQRRLQRGDLEYLRAEATALRFGTCTPTHTLSFPSSPFRARDLLTDAVCVCAGTGRACRTTRCGSSGTTTARRACVS